ncbi:MULTISPECIES: TetR/AcrR family transcriptional regulator [Arthrobacter]|uniref:TetR/AcrR family transcriptional regulator n=1 Tax=Arthrobacter TaxID=1663 RepID=UPI0021582048|nr:MULTISPECIES: TetR/AcrR family transcriptional regulator [Arthrobacter]
MQTSVPAEDRRQALKDRHRQAIITAAAALMHEGQTTDFSVDELAQRADVSRRTVFNHFASIRDIVSEVCSGVLSSAVESLTAVSPVDAARPGMFAEIAEAFRAADLVAPMAYLTRLLGPGAVPDSTPRQAQAHPIALRAFTELNDRLSVAMLSRYPEADRLGVDLLVGSLTSGLGVLYHHWHCATGAVDTPEARRVWSDLLDALLEKVRSGYVSDPASPQTLHP